MARILIVEDEKNLANGLKYNLESEDYLAEAVETAEEAESIFNNFDMMILDVMLPGMNGIELLTKIRESDNKFPVLILSARNSEEDRLNGLSAGADDYITKPFSLPEMLLRIRRILERQVWYNEASAREVVYAFGKFSINFSTFVAMTKMGKIKLTHYECYVMKYLIENKSRVVSRNELLEKVWGYSKETETRTVDIFVARLRKMFEENRKAPRHIQSMRGIGYQFFN